MIIWSSSSQTFPHRKQTDMATSALYVFPTTSLFCQLSYIITQAVYYSYNATLATWLHWDSFPLHYVMYFIIPFYSYHYNAYKFTYINIINPHSIEIFSKYLSCINDQKKIFLHSFFSTKYLLSGCEMPVWQFLLYLRLYSSISTW
jgi:hypothetical protein